MAYWGCLSRHSNVHMPLLNEVWPLPFSAAAFFELGVVEGSREQFYAISIERKLKHPAVVVITEAAKRKLFS